MSDFDIIQLEGFRELEDAFDDLSAAVGRAALRRAGIEAAEPMARLMRANAPKDRLDLSESIDVSTKLSERQAAQHRRMFRDDRASVELFVGPGPDPAGVQQEFGNINHSAQPFVRPAFDEDWRAFIERSRVEIADQLGRAAARAARKTARLAG